MKRWVKEQVRLQLEQKLNWLHEQNTSGFPPALKNKVILLAVTQFPWPIQLSWRQRVELHLETTQAADVTVSLSVTDLKRLQEGAALTELLKTEALKLEGDLQVLQWFATWMQTMDVDFYEPISQVAGDLVTHQLQKTIQGGRQRLKQVTQYKASQWSEFIQYESGLAPLKVEYADFVDAMKALEQQIRGLEKQLQSHSGD
jgi:ubiquinone biosynthesis protein UbiJ